jgi:cobalamin biosynthesis Co2+ chelatase CbiK
MRILSVTITIAFPALDALVSYLKDRDIQDAKLDQLAATVAALTDKLHESNQDLSEVVQANPNA